ncbi:MAG: hypothetical protein HYV03_02620 [Deltaproteobacteria bacterium]|nr:hypothetical protein [Deltaproteobacteria bacterium]
MKKRREHHEYDETDTTAWIDPRQRLSLKQLGFKLPPTPPTQVLSIRLPTFLLNQLRAKASAIDIPYQALIKMILARSVHHKSFSGA